MSAVEMLDKIVVAIADGGGRGHAFVNACRKSPHTKKILAFKGGDGWRTGPDDGLVECFADIDAGNVHAIIAEAQKQNVNLIIAGQEIFLVNGGADVAGYNGIEVMGCSGDAARLEASKVWAKTFFEKYRIPTADFEIAQSPRQAYAIVDYWFLIREVESLVLKADGLAEGKGVIIAHSRAEAHAAISEIMIDGTIKKTYPYAGNSLIVEEFIDGREMSATYFTDGIDLTPMLVGVDHKRRFDEDGRVPKDQNRMTGGMGLYAPDPRYSPGIREQVKKIARQIIEGMKNEHCPFRGILYLGLMICNGVVYVLEVNVRFGAPEAQGILALFDSDFVELAWATATGQLGKYKTRWKKGKVSVTVTLVSGPYPAPITAEAKGFEIFGLEEAAKIEGISVLHAGTKLKDDVFVNNGGRVIDIVAVAGTFKEAIALANRAAMMIHWQHYDYRKDIGKRVLLYAD